MRRVLAIAQQAHRELANAPTAHLGMKRVSDRTASLQANAPKTPNTHVIRGETIAQRLRSELANAH